MNGKVLVDKPLCVAIAQRKEDRRAPSQNLGKENDHKSLPETFSSDGDTHSCKVTKDASAHSKDLGFLQFSGEVTGQEAIGKLVSIIGKFSDVIMKLNGTIGEFSGIVRELNGTIGEFRGIVRELNGFLLNEKQVNMESSTKERELLVEKANSNFVFVKNFCQSTTEEDLKKIFGEIGLVTDVVVMRNEDGTSKCFGFVNFKNAEDAAKAVESLNGQRFDKKKWNSGTAQKKLERELELKNSFEQSVKEAVDKQSNLYVKNLSDSICDEEKLKELFSSFGLVTFCKVNRTREGRSRRSGFVAFSSPEEASIALSEMNGKVVFGKPLKVALVQRKEDRTARFQNLDKEIEHKALPETFLSSANAGSCKVATHASDRSMGFGSVHSGEESLQEATGEHNVMLLNGKQVHMGSSHNEEERGLSLEKPYFSNVMIKNFCKSTTEDDLKKVFGEFGLVTSTIIMRNKDQTSKCFGYVNFENAEDAARAVESLNGQIFNKKAWYVRIAQKSFKRELRLNHQFDSCRNEDDKGSNLCIENLDNSIAHVKLSEVFSPFKSLKPRKVMRDPNRISRGSGSVALSSPEQASESLSEKNGKHFSSKTRHVAQAQRKEDGRSWLRGRPGFGYEELLVRGVQPARPLMHSMSVPLIQNQQQDSHPGSRHANGAPMQKGLQPALATNLQMLPRGHNYHCPHGGMFSVRYGTGRLPLCEAVISESVQLGALASSTANASSLTRRQCWVKFCSRILSGRRRISS